MGMIVRSLQSRVLLPRIYSIRRTHNIQPPSSSHEPEPLITQADLTTYFEKLRPSGWRFRQTCKRLHGHDAMWWDLYRSARFPSFKNAMAYVNGVAEAAKSQRHHPSISVYNRVYVDVSLDTHDTAARAASFDDGRLVIARWPGLTMRDFEMAALINPLLIEHKALPNADAPSYDAPALSELLSVRITSS